MIYRPEIDGLRALAVIPVILFHAGFELFGGGFVGVDVFFVISGYLITTILIEDIEHNRFSIINFYERRARRILPALIIVSLFSVVSAWMLLTDTALYKFGNSLIGVSTFISNIIFWQQQGYFTESAELNPLLHTWSLAVEEQYYILFPIFLIMTWRFGKESVFWIIILMTVISLVISEWGWRNKANANFYLTPTRAWELFAGSITAFIAQKRGIKSNNIFAFIGFIAIFYSFLFYDNSTPFPSLYSLVPVTGVVLIVLYADSKTIVAKVLSRKTLVGIGLISYSSYLWHQPLFAYTRHMTNQIHIGHELRLILILATFIVAYFSWRYIEKPFRNKSAINQNSIFVMSLFSLAGLFLIGLASKETVKESHYALAKTLSENDFIYFQNMDERKFIEGRLFHPLKQVNYVVVGSSRAMQINSEMIGEPILNFSVSGASIEDDIAISLEAVTKIGGKNVLIGADPWLLNVHDGQIRYKSIMNLYEYWLERIINKMPPQNYLLSTNNISSSPNSILLALRNKLHKIKNLIPTDGKAEMNDKKSYDGSHIYNEQYINSAALNDDEFSKTLDYSMKFFEYDLKAEENLILLINYLKNLNVKITLVLSPYHPDLYQLMLSNKPIFIDIENKFRKISQQHNIKIIGSYDSSIVGCEPEEFYDGAHPKNTCMSKLFNDF